MKSGKALKDLLTQMTLREKIGQLDQYISPDHIRMSREQARQDGQKSADDTFGVYPGLSIEAMEERVIKGEIGSFLHVKDREESNHLQSLAMKSRLKIPLLIAVDAIHGHGLYQKGATIFPTQWTLSQSWDPTLAHKAARITAREMRATGFHWTFSPNVDTARDPRWGRYGETFGEDPLLCSDFGAAMVKGYRGDSPQTRVLSCIKHFVGGGFSEGGLNAAPVDLSERTIRSVLFPPFKAGVDAGADTIMAAHNDLNGTPCHGNSWLFQDILRREWGFQGFTVSDWMDMERLHGLFELTETLDEAFQLSLEAGVDVHMHGPGFLEAICARVESGKIALEPINRAVLSILKFKDELGLFESPLTGENESRILLSQENKAAALKQAVKSIVLLENRGILPLNEITLKGKILVTGPASDHQAILGDWTYEQPRKNISTLLDGIIEIAGNRVIHAPVTSFTEINSKEMDQAVRAAGQCDILMAAVGDNSLRTAKDKTCGENVDRAQSGLPGNQDNLVNSLLSTGKPVILLVVGGRPLDLTPYKKSAAAILFVGEPGMAAGKATALLLFGRENPSARLTGTFPSSSAVHPQYGSRQKSHFFHKYCDTGSEPCYPFAHGLSYSEFDYGEIQIPESIKAGEEFTVTVEVINKSTREGEWIIPLFLNQRAAPYSRPKKHLASYAKVLLREKERTRVELIVKPDQYAVFDNKGEARWYPGEIDVQVDIDGPTVKSQIIS